MANDPTPDAPLRVLNHADQKAVVYTGRPKQQLDVHLLNSTGGDITFQPHTSVIEIFMPRFFKPDDLSHMGIALDGWGFSFNKTHNSLVLTYAGAGVGVWAQGTAFDFSITGVESNAAPATENVQVNLSGMGGRVPPFLRANLSLTDPPQPGNADLTEVLLPSLDNQGSVYVSAEYDPLRNSLFLNLKNPSPDPLYRGKTMWKAAPSVLVTFVYGATSGALAPGDKETAGALGSAWNIQGKVAVDETAGWTISSLDPRGGPSFPQWTLQPVNTNQEVLGAGAAANVTFEFADIVSLTPTGHTQVTVHCKGFRQDENRLYNDHVFTLDIVKQNPPPTRGLLNFFATSEPVVVVTRPDQPIPVDLKWSMFDVAKVHLITGLPGVPMSKRDYPSPAPLAYDKFQFVLPGVSQSTPVFMTLQAFDGRGGYLNSLQFTVFVDARMFTDADGKVYPTVLVRNRIWMAQNLDYTAPGGASFYYNRDGHNATPFGQLYPWQVARQNIPPGWRLPSEKDWQDLLDAFGSPQAAYKALAPGGSSGFDAQLGGYRDDGGNFSDNGAIGYYWTASESDASAFHYALFSGKRGSLILGNAYPPAYAFSVRYVRDA
jgi:uncharacterized protein (TIGR02145 family)